MNLAVSSPQELAEPLPLKAPTPSAGGGFASLLHEVNDILERADQLAAGFAAGKVGLTDAVLASEKADTTFQLVMAVRNRALAAYQEIASLQL
ncbi:MAG TPA: flagellar hook-basal body complex protein FliE [Candidatus Binataceae bacterium]|jgi:flagellar hook-basal body complex protein FliE|nr:flagellar hook-basal body complex protein FliE [Candidatus Binataceae bacterium]